MWNWREFYELLERVRGHTQVLCSGESIVQLPPEEGADAGEAYVLLHTVSGLYRGRGKKISFCGHDAERVQAARLLWLYLKRMYGTREVLFNAVFMKAGRREQEKARRRQQHGIRMVYKRMAHGQEGSLCGYSMDGGFYKLAIIGCRETGLRTATIAELLYVFADATDERGMIVLAEKNARELCQKRHAVADERLCAAK